MTAEWLEHTMALSPRKSREYLDAFIESGQDPNEDGIMSLIIQRCACDTKFFAQVFLYESFSGLMSWQHDKYWEMLDDERIPYAVINAWRGFGKTTGMKAKVIKSICFRQQEFVMWIGKSGEFATRETENIKLELISNPRIRYIFGQMRATKYEGVDVTFSKASWYACDPTTGEPMCYILPRGAGQPVRGASAYIKGRTVRPTLIIIDDLEDDEDVLNDETRRKIRDWFNGALLNCVDTMARPKANFLWSKEPCAPPPWRLFYVDTLKHEDAMIAHLLEDSQWRGIKLPMCEFRERDDGKGEYYSCIPELFTDEQVRVEAVAADRRGQLDTFCREKMCLPVSPEKVCFSRSMFQYYSESDVKLSRSANIDRFLIVDPAKTANQESAYTAILAGAADCDNGRIYLRCLVNERLSPDGILDKTFAVALRTNTRLIFVETTGLDEHIKYLFKNAASLRGLPVEFAWLKAQSTPQGDYGTGREAKKRARAGQIIPFYRKKQVYHENSLRDSALEHQALSYPRPAKWDALDCAGYIPQALEYMGRYFMARIEEGSPQFEEMEGFSDYGEAIMNGTWRTI